MKKIITSFIILLSFTSIYCQVGQMYETCEEAGANPILTKDELENNAFTMLDSANIQGPTPLCSNGGVISNISWISFIVSENKVQINLP